MADTELQQLEALANHGVKQVAFWLRSFLSFGASAESPIIDVSQRVAAGELSTAGDHLDEVLLGPIPTDDAERGARTSDAVLRVFGDAAAVLLEELISVPDPVGQFGENYVTDVFSLLESFPTSRPKEMRTQILRPLNSDPRFTVEMPRWGNVNEWVERAMSGQSQWG